MMRKPILSFDVVIVGGGVAGGISAIHLASAGQNVALFEKEKSAHHKVCGEFLSHEGAEMLAECGIDLHQLGATPIRFFRFHGPSRTSKVKLKKDALGLSRRRLDEIILNRAEAVGARVFRGQKVRGIDTFFEGFNVETAEQVVCTKKAVMATGKSDLAQVQKRLGRDSSYSGFKMHLSLSPELAEELRESCDLFIFPGGYGGIAPIENNQFNFCFVLKNSVVKQKRGRWGAMLDHICKTNSSARRVLDGATWLFDSPVSVASVPYGFIRTEEPTSETFFVGDQMAVIPSLVGDGMSLAAFTGRAAAQQILLHSGGSSVCYQKQILSHVQSQMKMAYLIHLLFKMPTLCNWAAVLLNRFPQIAEYFISRTRCRPEIKMTLEPAP